MTAPPAPQIAIAASGEGTPFRLTLLRDGTAAKASVDGDALGKVSRARSDHPSGEAHLKRRIRANGPQQRLHAGRSAGRPDDRRHGTCRADADGEQYRTDQRLSAR